MSFTFNDPKSLQPEAKRVPSGIKALLSNNATNGLSVETHSQTADTFRGHDHVSTGLAYNIRGRADRIEVQVGDSLATFQDPIKALLGTRICSSKVVMVSRKYVLGGAAVATPERAPARIVKVQEDIMHVELTRYGADIEMNLNLFLRPGDAQQEMDLKLNAQKKALENELIRMGYRTVMDNGIPLQDAIVRSKSMGKETHASMEEAAEHVYRHAIFGAFQMHDYPLQNLIAGAKNASAYLNVVGAGSIMIVPHATPELITWTKPCHMEYNITGVSHKDKKPVTMSLDNCYVEPMVGMKIMVHHPPADHTNGTIKPKAGATPLTRKVTVAGWVSSGATHVVDFGNGTWKPSSNIENKCYWRRVSFMMSSAIIGKPGADTGELLVGYPFTSVSTNQTTESMTVQLRVYLGAILKQTENVIVLPDVSFDGYIGDHRFSVVDIYALMAYSYFASGLRPSLITEAFLDSLARYYPFQFDDHDVNFNDWTVMEAMLRLTFTEFRDDWTSELFLRVFEDHRVVLSPETKRLIASVRVHIKVADIMPEPPAGDPGNLALVAIKDQLFKVTNGDKLWDVVSGPLQSLRNGGNQNPMFACKEDDKSFAGTTLLGKLDNPKLALSTSGLQVYSQSFKDQCNKCLDVREDKPTNNDKFTAARGTARSVAAARVHAAQATVDGKVNAIATSSLQMKSSADVKANGKLKRAATQKGRAGTDAATAV